MAGEDNGGGGGSNLSVEVSEGGNSSLSADLGSNGKPTREGEGKGTTSLDLDTATGKPEGEDLEADPNEDGDEQDPEGNEPEGDGDEGDKPEDGGDGDDEDALPDFEPDNEENLAQYDARYFSEDGTTLKLEAFNASLEKSLAAAAAHEGDGEAPKPDISGNERAYLKHRLGISDAAIDQHIAGVLAVREKMDAAIHGMAGGKDAYDAMVAWGAEGYTQAQKDSFNAAFASGNSDAIQEQMDLLKVRFERAGGKLPQGTQQQRKGPPGPPRRAASPARSTSEKAGGAGSGVKGFANEAEWRKAQQAAGDDEAAHMAVRKRFLASSWATKG